MLKIMLHTIASFLETGLGIYIFGQVFPERKRFEKQQWITVWALYTLIMFVLYLKLQPNVSIEKMGIIYLLVTIVHILTVSCFEKNAWIRKREYKVLRIFKIFLILIVSGLVAWNAWLSYVSNSTIMGCNAYLPFLLFICYQCKMYQGYFMELLYLSIIGILKTIYLIYIGAIENVIIEEVNRTNVMHSYNAIFYELFIYGCIMLLIKKFSIGKVLKRIIDQHEKILCIIAVAGWGLVTGLLCLGMNGFDEKDFAIAIVVAAILVSSSIFMVLQFLLRSVESEKRLLDVRNEAIEQQYREIRKAYEENRYLLHDEKHMISYLLECLEEGDLINALGFLEKYREGITNQSRYSWTGIPTLDFIINIKKRKMDKLSAEFILHAQIDILPVEDADFVVLLGNLFDNAIEAVERCEVNKREIMLTIRNVNEMFLLRMRNTNSQIPIKVKDQFVSSKDDRQNHGLGIESVKHIINKYSGDIEIQYDETMFQVCIMINT
ncbi:MAG: GHKL domain-containing protein [Lachnospiraceae bacterium]|nr:GHKL domain-containing protein [Lachnospiraceae bacterium]